MLRRVRFSASIVNASNQFQNFTSIRLKSDKYIHEPQRVADPLDDGSFPKDRFERNLAATREADEKIQLLISSIKAGLPENEKARNLHVSRGKLLVRDRVKSVLDADSSFLELSPLAAYDLYPKDYPPCAGIVCGIGKIFGTRCVVMANDATVKGGTYYPVSAKKQIRAQKIAQQNTLPCVYLVDSGGGNLERQAEGFADEQNFGRLFYNQANMSALGIPQVSCVMGSCTAGGAYIPCMSDETIIVKNVGTIFLGGPQLVFAATGEVNSPEELGGGEMHCTKSGTADNLADDDQQGLVMTRRVVRNLNRKHQKLNVTNVLDKLANDDSLKPLYGTKDVAGFVDPPSLGSSTSSKPVDTRGVISRLVDLSNFDEFKALYGPQITCGFAEIEGIPVAVIADDGRVMSGDAGLKGAHFVQMCAQRRLPIIFLHGGGSFASVHQNDKEAAKHAAKFISAVATVPASVPKLTVVLRGSISDGAFAMCGRSMDPRFLFMWPTAKISVASDALEQHQGDSSNNVMSSTFSSARIFDDGVISPQDTRSVLGEALRCCMCREESGNDGSARPRFGVLRM